MYVMPTKDPNATKDYQVNWADWLPSGDTISVSTWIVPTGITKVTDSTTTLVTTIWLSGGTAGKKYHLTNRITTANGRIEDRTITVPCSET